MKTLLIEDDRSTLRVLEKILTRRNHEVTACKDGETALKAFQQEKHPLIILDMILPGMDGFTFMKKLRKFPEGKWNYILVITGMIEPDRLKEILDAGANDYMTKPIAIQLFNIRIDIAEKQVENLLERKEQRVKLDDYQNLLEKKVEIRTEELQNSHQFLQSTLDSLSASICIIDKNGVIITTNLPWREFADENNLGLPDYGIGKNYFDYCRPNHDDDYAKKAKEGIKNVLAGNQKDFVMEYPSHSPTKKRWFVMKVKRFHRNDQIYAVISHQNITERRKFVEKLQENEEKYRNLLEGLNEAVFRMSIPDGKYEYVSPAVQKVFGYPIKKFGENPLLIREVIAPENYDYFVEKWEKLIQGDVEPIYEYKIIDMEGKERWILQSNRGIYDRNGNIIALEGLCRDITEKRKAEQELKRHEQQFKALVENAPDIIARFDRNLRYIYVNPVVEKETGISPSKFIGKTIREVGFSEPSIERWEEILRKVFDEGTAKNIEISYPLHGKNKVFKAHIVPEFGEDGDVESVLSIIRDITEQKETEEALRAFNEMLEEKVEERTEELNQLLEKQKELNELKSRFISIVSHEFRTPLTSIESSAEIMQRYGQKLSNSIKMKHLTRILRNIEDMINLLDSVIIIGKAETGKIGFKPKKINVEKFTQEFLEEMELVFKQERRLNYISDRTPKFAFVDEKLLRHILSNLITNAAKYSDSQSSIDIELKSNSSSIVYSVRDDGIGIPEEDKESLFESFHRATNVGNISGSGLGLTIVKKCVELHNGSVSFVSNLGAGTTFKVMLPFNKEDNGDANFNH